MQKENSKIPVATNEASQIPNEKVSLSSAKKEGAMDHENTMSGKSARVCDEEKVRTDSTIIPIQLIDRPSPYKVYRHQDYERVGRLSRNRAKDSKGTRYYVLGLISVMGQMRSGEILFKANLQKQEEKRKLKKLKKEQSLLTKDRKIRST